MKFILFLLLFPSVLLNEGHAYFKHAATLEDSKGNFCIEVRPKEAANELPSQPKMALVLKVAYPNYSVVEAGKVILRTEELLHGKHNITYKYLISNMAHDLQVQLDGSPKKFIKTDESGWYSVSSFREIDVLTQGNVKLKSCSGDELMKKVEPQKDFSGVDDESEESFFLRDDSETTEKYLIDDLTTKTSGKSVYMTTTTANVNVGDLNKKTTPVPSSKELETAFKYTSTEFYLLSSSAGNYGSLEVTYEGNTQRNISIDYDAVPDIKMQVDKLQLTSTESTSDKHDPYNNHKFLINSFMYNDTHSEIGHTENVLSAHESHNYTIAIALLIGLIALVIVAVIVSVIFHSKNKKLVLAKPRSNNRLHKLYDSTNVSGETRVMLEKLESTLESEC